MVCFPNSDLPSFSLCDVSYSLSLRKIGGKFSTRLKKHETAERQKYEKLLPGKHTNEEQHTKMKE